MAWPLAVAAIDVNLARSAEENIRRTQKMSCLGEIYRYLTEVADVTSFVTSGAKQILLLANTAIQQIITEDQTQSPSSMTAEELYEIGSFSNTSYSMSCSASHLHDWVDVFVHYPTVYLLISKATDYALSCGRLPDQDKLPTFLRSTTILSAIDNDLPWFRSHSNKNFKEAPLEQDRKDRRMVVAEEYGVKECQMPEIPRGAYMEALDPENYFNWSLKSTFTSRKENEQDIFQVPDLDAMEWNKCDHLNIHDEFCELDSWLWSNTEYETGLQVELLC